jgi:hypothetical protein
MIDELLLLEIESLKQKMYLMFLDLKEHEPNLEYSDYLHDLSTRNYQEELEEKR